MSVDLKKTIDDYERELSQAALAEAGGHQRRAAASLGLLPSTLCEKIKRSGFGNGRKSAEPRWRRYGASFAADARAPVAFKRRRSVGALARIAANR